MLLIVIGTIIMAIGTSPNPLIKATTKGLDVNKHGGIIVEETTGATSKAGVYAGGDAVTGAATVILGSYDTFEELIAAHPTANEGDAFLVDGVLFVWHND